MTNIHRTLYVGVTSDLVRRVYEHKENLVEGFTKQYGLRSLVYYAELGDALTAIRKEKQIKGWLRRKKIALIEAMNPTWKVLSEELLGTDSSAPLRSASE